jgi:hypothetical protein
MILQLLVHGRLVEMSTDASQLVDRFKPSNTKTLSAGLHNPPAGTKPFVSTSHILRGARHFRLVVCELLELLLVLMANMLSVFLQSIVIVVWRRVWMDQLFAWGSWSRIVQRFWCSIWLNRGRLPEIHLNSYPFITSIAWNYSRSNVVLGL